MNLYDVIPFAHHLLANAVNEGDTVIDATVGNGHDTIFLADQVGATGRVVGFDIQAKAIEKTKRRLNTALLDQRVHLIEESHEHIGDVFRNRNYPPPPAAVFNLGYLPGSDKTIVTKGTSTIAAITQLLRLMPRHGLIILVIYPGHPEGKKERDQLLSFTSSLDQQAVLVAHYEFTNRKNHPPFLLAVEKQ